MGEFVDLLSPKVPRFEIYVCQREIAQICFAIETEKELYIYRLVMLRLSLPLYLSTSISVALSTSLPFYLYLCISRPTNQSICQLMDLSAILHLSFLFLNFSTKEEEVPMPSVDNILLSNSSPLRARSRVVFPAAAGPTTTNFISRKTTRPPSLSARAYSMISKTSPDSAMLLSSPKEDEEVNQMVLGMRVRMRMKMRVRVRTIMR